MDFVSPHHGVWQHRYLLVGVWFTICSQAGYLMTAANYCTCAPSTTGVCVRYLCLSTGDWWCKYRGQLLNNPREGKHTLLYSIHPSLSQSVVSTWWRLLACTPSPGTLGTGAIANCLSLARGCYWPVEVISLCAGRMVHSITHTYRRWYSIYCMQQ